MDIYHRRRFSSNSHLPFVELFFHLQSCSLAFSPSLSFVHMHSRLIFIHWFFLALFVFKKTFFSGGFFFFFRNPLTFTSVSLRLHFFSCYPLPSTTTLKDNTFPSRNEFFLPFRCRHFNLFRLPLYPFLRIFITSSTSPLLLQLIQTHVDRFETREHTRITVPKLRYKRLRFRYDLDISLTLYIVLGVLLALFSSSRFPFLSFPEDHLDHSNHRRSR